LKTIFNNSSCCKCFRVYKYISLYSSYSVWLNNKSSVCFCSFSLRCYLEQFFWRSICLKHKVHLRHLRDFALATSVITLSRLGWFFFWASWWFRFRELFFMMNSYLWCLFLFLWLLLNNYFQSPLMKSLMTPMIFTGDNMLTDNQTSQATTIALLIMLIPNIGMDS